MGKLARLMGEGNKMKAIIEDAVVVPITKCQQCGDTKHREVHLTCGPYSFRASLCSVHEKEAREHMDKLTEKINVTSKVV